MLCHVCVILQDNTDDKNTEDEEEKMQQEEVKSEEESEEEEEEPLKMKAKVRMNRRCAINALQVKYLIFLPILTKPRCFVE